MPLPSTEHEWNIHVINIHGTFFERWCQNAIPTVEGWRVKSINYPVVYPRSSAAVKSKESALDIWAQKDISDLRLSLLIECKKNNPEFVNWVFFKKHPLSDKTSMTVSSIKIIKREPPNVGWNANGMLQTLQGSITITNDCRETRGDYLSYKKDNKKTKTSNDAISDAAYQVALATQAVSDEERDHADVLQYSQTYKLSWQLQHLLPVIVTTARMFICDFDPKNVDDRTGEINPKQATISGCEELVYEYALPRHLQFYPAERITILEKDSMEIFVRMPILVVQSQHFKEFLKNLYTTSIESPKTSGTEVSQ